jgi:hypothetical protein
VPSIRLAGTIMCRKGEQAFRQDHPETAKSAPKPPSPPALSASPRSPPTRSAVSQPNLATLLGPCGTNDIDRATAERFAHGQQGYEDMASWLGSKGWNSTRESSAKAKPQLPSALLRQHMSSNRRPRA